MTTLTDPPREGFRLSQLIYDTRYRSMTIQVVALIGFLVLIGWLISNTAQNLADLGKEPSFRFLSEPAGYDINQRLIDYNNQHSHFRAAVTGVLNTLLVAVLGCIAATILGVLIGVLRLSKNWLVSRLMAVYVEIFRNVPVLLWIVFIMAILIESLPKPRSFRGPDAETSMSLFGSTAFSNQGVFIPRLVPANYFWVLILVVIVSVLGIRFLRRRADKIQEATGDRPKTFLASLGVAIVPFLIAFFAITAVTSNREQAFIGAGIQGVGTLEEFATEKGRISYCHAGGDAGSLNGLRFLEANDVQMRRRQYFSPSASLDAMAVGKCDLVTVAASRTDSTIVELKDRCFINNSTHLQKGIDKARAIIESGEGDVEKARTTIETNTGLIEKARVKCQALPLSVLPTTFTEGKAIEVELPAISEKGIPRFEGGTHLRNSLIALWIALSLYTAAFIAEIVRAGILAISHGQSEAAAALGLRPNRIMSLVVLPQALRVIIPPLISNYLNLTKNSSLAIAVGYMDITGTLMGITLNQTGRELETVLLGMLIYLAISLSISAVMNWYNNRMKLVER
ncbi:ABC transporter permease subunit [Rhodobacteraceae bacterium D3-12]|nr:ABC transporter permease subunit [Rhodobacteraceae bacterium D3-12]